MHDGIRGVDGHFGKTLEAASNLLSMGFNVQINTTVMRENAEQLADIALILRKLGIRTWEVFFLVSVGRGEQMKELTPEQNEDVCNFLADITQYGFIVRTVEAPFFRRVLSQRQSTTQDKTGHGPLYYSLRDRMIGLLGKPVQRMAASTLATRDGKGIIFISQNGEVYPSGFLPHPVGNVRSESITDIYRNSRMLVSIRKGEFSGRCGACEYRDLCGGSRSRAYSRYGDALAEDPGCPYIPLGF